MKFFKEIRQRVVLLIVATLIFFAANWRTPVVHAVSGDEDFIPGEVVVKLTSSSDLAGVASQHALNPTPLDQFGSRPIYRLRITDGARVEDRVNQLLLDTRVIFAEPNFIEKPPEGGGKSWSVGTPSAYLAQWAPSMIRLPEAQAVNRGIGAGGQPVRIAVLDTGVDVTHPALAGHLLPGFDFVDMDANPSEVGTPNIGPYGHGTHVAGLIALVAPEAKIIPVRVLDQNGLGNTWVLAEALAYAVDPDGDPATNDGADVINLSLSTLRRTRLLRSVLARICDDDPAPGEEDIPATANSNLVVVAAAGNGGDFTEQYPAAENIGGLIGVSASTSQDQLATFSTRGSWIRVAAPGQGITSTIPGAQYGAWSGTSMAAPFVAAEAALIHAQFPMLRNTKIIDHIAKTGARIDGPVPVRIDVGRALTTTPELATTPTPTPTPTPSATPTPTPVIPPELLTNISTNRAVALHSVLQTAEPFPLLTPGNFSSDQRTRVTLFAKNIQLLPGETLSVISVSAVDTRNVAYILPVESASFVPGFDWLLAVMVRLPEDASLKGDLSITLSLRGVKSNTAVIGIRSP